MFSGCTHHDFRTTDRRTQPLPAAIAAYYDYPKNDNDAHVEFVADHARYRSYRVTLPFSTDDEESSASVIQIEWYVSKSGPGPVVLVHPILGGSYPIERSVCRFFARNGYHVAMPRREPLRFAPQSELDDIERLLRETVVRARQVIDWLETQPEVDSNRIYSFGISFGANTTVILAAVEPRIRKHVAALAGGNLPSILATSGDRIIRKRRKPYLSAHSMDANQLKTRLQTIIRTDPLLLAPHVRPAKLTMLFAHFDRTIGKRNSLRLWEALGRPEATFVPFGHYTSIVVLPYLKILSMRAYSTE